MSSALINNLELKAVAITEKYYALNDTTAQITEKINNINPSDKDAAAQLEALMSQREEIKNAGIAAVNEAKKEYEQAKKQVELYGDAQDQSDAQSIISNAQNTEQNVIRPLLASNKQNFLNVSITKKQEIEAISASDKSPPDVKTPNAPTSPAEVKETLPPADSSTGLGTANYNTKINEGLTAASSTYGVEAAPFEKIVSNGPTFGQLSNPLAVAQSQGNNPFSGPLTSIIAARTDQPTPASAQATNAATGANKPNPDDKTHLVTLDDQQGNIVEFLVMPEIIENRAVGYEPVVPAQFPGAFQKYKGTESVQWQVNATFISRTTEEATKNLINLNILRGWTMPYFGDKIKDNPETSTKLGAPPPVLIFKGFRYAIVGPVPVVITSLNWSWPRDVDYIQTTAPDGSSFNVPFPTVMTVAIQLVESFSTEQFNKFDRDAYTYGDFEGAFGGVRAFAKNGKSVQSTDSEVSDVSGVNDDTKKKFADLSVAITSPPSAQTIEGPNSDAYATIEARKAREALAIAERKVLENPYVSSTVNIMKSGQGGDFGGGGATGIF